MTTNTKHWIAHIVCSIVIIVLSSIILSPSKDVKNQSGLVEHLQKSNEKLRIENDSVKVLADKLISQVNAPDPQPEIKIKYIERNEQVEMVQDSSLIDAFIAIVQKHKSERTAEDNP